MNQLQCRECGAVFEMRTVTQKFCSGKCCRDWHNRNRREGIRPERRSITFRCANPKCGRIVETETERRDMRTRFCCAACEKAYWRHPPQDSTVGNVVKTIRGIAAEHAVFEGLIYCPSAQGTCMRREFHRACAERKEKNA